MFAVTRLSRVEQSHKIPDSGESSYGLFCQLPFTICHLPSYASQPADITPLEV